ncbi:hypothetical protein LJB42_000810 [Komagataella kurtzmanii]|nr:hypothetical protein LJB42_000810 [Komagataella kurtzmanii]
MDLQLSQWVSQFMALENDPPCEEIAKAVIEKRISLLQLIKTLGSHLTDETPHIRSTAVGCLSNTLAKIERLNRADIEVIAKFYIGKLDDNDVMSNTLVGLRALTSLKNFNPALLESVLTSVQEKYEPASFLAATRYQSFLLLETIYQKHLDFILANHNDLFVKVFIRISTNEKDPRNLLISFSLNKQISSTLQVENFAEDLFDNAFCYFPVSFKPPPNSPYSIASHDLKTGLREVFAATPLFAKDLFPNILEKLTSTSPAVKLDVLQTLNLCLDTYDNDTIQEYWLTLYNALKFEVLYNDLANIVELADIEKLSTEDDLVFKEVIALFKNLPKKFTGEQIIKNLQIMLEELKEYLHISHKYFKQTVLLLSVMATSKLSVYNHIVGEVLPVLLTDEPSTVVDEKNLASALNFFINPDYPESKLSQYKDDILVVLSKGLMSSSNVETTLKCICIRSLVNLSFILDTQEVASIISNLSELLLSTMKNEKDPIFQETLNAFTNISATMPNVVLETTLPLLLSKLPNESSSEIDLELVRNVLNVVVNISHCKLLLDSIIVRLLSVYERLLNGRVVTIDYYYLLLNSIYLLLSNYPELLSKDYADRVIPQITSLTIVNYRLSKESPVYLNERILDQCGKIIRLIICKLELIHHQKILDNAVDTFLLGSDSPLFSTSLGLEISLVSKPPTLVSLFNKFLSAVSKDCPFKMEPLDVLSSLVEITRDSKHFESLFERMGFLELICLLANKYISDSDLEKILNELSETIDLQSSDSLGTLEVMAWITKSLVLSNSPLAMKYQEYFFSLLEIPSVASVSPKLLEVLIAEVSELEVNKRDKKIINLNVRLLYKQKFYNIMLPKIIEGYRNCEQASKETYLLLLSLILNHVHQREIILSHLENILPLILQIIQSDNAKSRNSGLEILNLTIESNCMLIKPHLHSIIPRLLAITKDNSDLNGQINALLCLKEIGISKIPLSQLQPFRTTIINQTVSVLSHKKRKVRKLAADVRQIYYELEQS